VIYWYKNLNNKYEAEEAARYDHHAL